MSFLSRSIPFAACVVTGGIGAIVLVGVWPGAIGLQRGGPPPVPAQAVVKVMPTWSDLTAGGSVATAERFRGLGCPPDVIQRILGEDDAAQGPMGSPAASQPASSAPRPAVVTAAAVSRLAQSTPTPVPIVASAYPRDLVIVAPTGDVPLPIAFQSLPQDSNLSPEKRARLDAIQEQFLTAIGGPNQDPASPTYQTLWRKAQRDADTQFRAVFGATEFMRRFTASLREQRSESATR